MQVPAVHPPKHVKQPNAVPFSPICDTTMASDEHVESAEVAGLRYVNEAMPGIRRHRRGHGFFYTQPDGARLVDAEELERIRKLVIPPAWTDVWICPIPTGHLQVTARDARGRKQYRYHTRYRETRDGTKFGRMVAFSEVLPRIRLAVERHIGGPELTREKVLATVVWLLERTLIRVGKDMYARENGSFGLTTLRRRHVEVSGSNVRFDFRGKSGVRHSVSITSRKVARIVQRCQELPGQELFRYIGPDGRRQTIEAMDINDYLREISGRQVTAKDFRTWGGTVHAAVALRGIGPAATEKEAKANVIRAIDDVAKRLGNTRAVCRKYYVHPHVLEAYMEGVVIPATPALVSNERRNDHPPTLRRDEVAVVTLLRARAKKPGDLLDLPRIPVESEAGEPAA